jgi:hypothetical protein
MYIMYVDESGDPGVVGSASQYYFLSALVVHESYWMRFLSDAIQFRRHIKKTKGLLMREEIHASAFVTKRIKLRNSVSRNERVDILKKCIDWISTKSYLSVITVRVDKTVNADPFQTAWRTLIQRFENTLRRQNFPNPAFNTDLGAIVADNTDGKKLTGLLRKMRKINFVPSMFPTSPARNMPIRYVIKDPIYRESKESYLVQLVDVVVYFARQYYLPNKYIRQKAARNYYAKLTPVINQHTNKSHLDYRIIHV